MVVFDADQEARTPNLNHKVRVVPSDEQRREFQEVCRGRSVEAGKVRRAPVLLLSDEGSKPTRRRTTASTR